MDRVEWRALDRVGGAVKPEERLAKFRQTMTGAEVPNVLLHWMREVEGQLIEMRIQLVELTRIADAVRCQEMMDTQEEISR